MYGEVALAEIAYVDCAGAIVGELVGGGAADAKGGVGAGYYHDFIFHSPAHPTSTLAVFSVNNQSTDWQSGRKSRGERGSYGPAESPAMRRILGMSSKVPGSAGLTVSCSLRAWRRFLEADVMLGFLSAL